MGGEGTGAEGVRFWGHAHERGQEGEGREDWTLMAEDSIFVCTVLYSLQL